MFAAVPAEADAVAVAFTVKLPLLLKSAFYRRDVAIDDILAHPLSPRRWRFAVADVAVWLRCWPSATATAATSKLLLLLKTSPWRCRP